MDQDQDTQTSASSTAVTLCRKSWTAYLGMVVRTLLIAGLCIAAIYWRPDYWKIAAILLVISLTLISYQWLLLHSYRLYFDAGGVWIYSGVLPWKRGVSGVKWRDLDEAIFVNSFWSWMSGSYTVQLKHRFTKAVEISETHMASGKQAVVTINQELLKRIGQEAPGLTSVYRSAALT